MKYRMLVAIFVYIFSLLLPSISMATTEISPDSINDWMKAETLEEGSYIPPEGQERVNTLLMQAVTFRGQASKGLESAIKETRAPADIFSIFTTSPGQKKFPEIWPYIFAGSMVFAGNVSSDKPVSGYYNPYLDSMVLITWRASGNSFTPDKILAMTGATFLNGNNDPTAVSEWITNGGTAMELLKQHHRIREHFTRLFPFNSSKRPKLNFEYDTVLQREILEVRSLRAYLKLQTLLHEKDVTGFRTLVKEIKTTISAGSEKELARFLPADNIMSPKQVIEIPQVVRENLIPVYVLVGSESALLFQQASIGPRFITVTKLNSQGPPEVQGFAFFDLEASHVR